MSTISYNVLLFFTSPENNPYMYGPFLTQVYKMAEDDHAFIGKEG